MLRVLLSAAVPQNFLPLATNLALRPLPAVAVEAGAELVAVVRTVVMVVRAAVEVGLTEVVDAFVVVTGAVAPARHLMKGD